MLLKRKKNIGFPHLSIIKQSIKLLIDRLSPKRLASFSRCLSPDKAVISAKKDIIIAVQSLATIIIHHLQLPNACILVSFRDMENPGQVELSSADNYIVDLHTQYRNNRSDIAAILAHEITHVFLHRHNIGFANTLENEILTDTAAVYLGVGWLSLNAYRKTEERRERYVGFNERQIEVTTKEERLGYLTPKEFGYVLGKRSLAFEEKVGHLIKSKVAKLAFKEGFRLALSDRKSAPLAESGFLDKLKYYWDKGRIQRLQKKFGLTGISRKFGGYQFEFSDLMRVIFECPVCSQKLRLPINKKVIARCSVCDSSFMCNT